MASAMLATHNEPYFGDNRSSSRAFMSQNSNPILLSPNPNPNPTFLQSSNPNPNFIHQIHNHSNNDNSHGSIQERPKEPADSRGYVRFDISSYSKMEIRDLKRRLISELDQVRSVMRRIELREMSHLKSTAEMRKLHAGMMKKCGQILTRLMKHKGGIWFNSPVDVVGMGLHDYHHIIKNPMDLGTVKSKLGKGFYLSALDFASDVRLTFNNALVYNPQGHDVHRLADQLLKQFDSVFGPAYAKFEKQKGAIARKDEGKKLVFASHLHPVVQRNPVFETQQPKPKVKEMNMAEKEKLGMALQNLPEDKMNEVLGIVRRRNVETLVDGDEVEIDFELMDDETLWELDRFVGDWNKMVMSKVKKRQEVGMASGQNIPHSLPSDNAANKSPLAVGEAQEAVAMKKIKKGDLVDEDVDIGDEMPNTQYPSVEIEKESSSSSSGSGSSSSSGSDSGSSSRSDSEDDDAQSPAVGSRPSPRS